MSGKMFLKPELPENFVSSDDEEVCTGHALGFPVRSELGFLPVENVTLDVFRCICEVYSTGYSQPWEFAMRAAESYTRRRRRPTSGRACNRVAKGAKMRAKWRPLLFERRMPARVT